MKKALQTRSPRAARLALALALGLAAASHSAQAAIVQITLNRVFTAPLGFVTYYVNDVTGQSTESNLKLSLFADANYKDVTLEGTDGSYVAYSTYNGNTNPHSLDSLSSAEPFQFKDPRINNNQLTTAYAQGVGESVNNIPQVTLTRMVFDDASTSFSPSSFGSNTAYAEWVPASSAVPEPGAFIPAAVLVAGALLRRRRSRSHRSGRATA
jgi:MYXO-CTERM domain-containing protein